MQYRDRVLVDTPFPLVVRSVAGATVVCTVQSAAVPEEEETVVLSEVPSSFEVLKFFAGTYVPTVAGWYYVTSTSTLGEQELGIDSFRFYCYTADEDVAGSAPFVGEAVQQEVAAKVGEPAHLSYRGTPGLSVTAKIVHETELQTPNIGIVVSLTAQPVPTGYSPLYTAQFVPTREGKHYVYIRTTPGGGEALLVVSAFRTLPYSRAAGSIKSTATSTVL